MIIRPKHPSLSFRHRSVCPSLFFIFDKMILIFVFLFLPSQHIYNIMLYQHGTCPTMDHLVKKSWIVWLFRPGFDLDWCECGQYVVSERSTGRDQLRVPESIPIQDQGDLREITGGRRLVGGWVSRKIIFSNVTHHPISDHCGHVTRYGQAGAGRWIA